MHREPITKQDPFGIRLDLLDNESFGHLTCPQCGNHTVIKLFDQNVFNYPEWKANTEFENMNSKNHVKSRIPNALSLSKSMKIHPTRVFDKLVSCYWSAWDWDTCEQIAIDHLKTKCYNCKYELEYLRVENEN